MELLVLLRDETYEDAGEAREKLGGETLSEDRGEINPEGCCRTL